jgi:small-conductance mechanosensitive channel
MNEFVKRWLLNPTMGRLVAALIGILVVIVVVRLIQRTLSRGIHDTDTRYRARKFVTFAGYLLGIGVLAVVFSDKLGGFTVALGVAGAGIAWVKGDLYSGRVVRIANSFVFKEPVFNYSGDFPFLWDEITIPVKYGSDYRLARQIIQEVADGLVADYSAHAEAAWKGLVKKYKIEDARIHPLVSLTANDNWVELTLRYVVDYKRRRMTKDALFSRILEEIDRSGGRIRIASTTLEVVDGSRLDVKLVKPG